MLEVYQIARIRRLPSQSGFGTLDSPSSPVTRESPRTEYVLHCLDNGHNRFPPLITTNKMLANEAIDHVKRKYPDKEFELLTFQVGTSFESIYAVTKKLGGSI